MRNLKKMLLGAVTAMVVAAGVAVSPASATVPSWGNTGVNENNNVPYLAWRGEHVRLGFCTGPSNTIVPGAVTRRTGLSKTGAAILPTGRSRCRTSWPGPPSGPRRLLLHSFTSQKAGVAFIKFGLTTATGYQAVYNQFVVIWMDLLKPTATIIGDD